MTLYDPLHDNPSLQLQLFGSPQIFYQGKPLKGFLSDKVRALLIYLAVTHRPHSRDHLAALLWSDTPATMKANLRKALSNLRQLIGDRLMEEGKELVWLDQKELTVDVCEFEQAIEQGHWQEATQRYQADFLTGFNISQSYEFEMWVLSEQCRFKAYEVNLLRAMAAQQENTENLAGAIQTLHRLLALEPWCEEVHCWLMTLLSKNGQRGAALMHFEVCKRMLHEELSVEPGEETYRLVEKIRHSCTSPIGVFARYCPATQKAEASSAEWPCSIK